MAITLEELKHHLETNMNWLERGILALYRMQTMDEQKAEATKHHNKRGFMACEAHTGSYIAKWLLKGNRIRGDRWIKKARRVCLKHAKQLHAIATGKLCNITRAQARVVSLDLDGLNIRRLDETTAQPNVDAWFMITTIDINGKTNVYCWQGGKYWILSQECLTEPGPMTRLTPGDVKMLESAVSRLLEGA